MPWHVSVVGPPLSESEYLFLCQLYQYKLCDVHLFKAWHDHSFGGVYPEHLWFDLAKLAPDTVMDTDMTRGLRHKVPKTEGVCIFDHENGYATSDSSVPTKHMLPKLPGGVILMYSGGGKSHFIRENKELGLVDGDDLVDFAKGWNKDRKLRKQVMKQYENNILQSALKGDIILVNVNDEKIIDKWVKAGVVVGYVPVSKELMEWKVKHNLLRSDQVGRMRHRVEAQKNWAKRGVKSFETLEAAIEAAKNCERSLDQKLLPQLKEMVRRNQYCVEKHSWMVRRIWPGTSKMLDEREQVSVPLAVAMAQQQIQHHDVDSSTVFKVFDLCLGMGAQLMTNAIVWCCGLEGGWHELLMLQDKFGFFSLDMKGFMDSSKLFHSLVRNTDDVSWFGGRFSADHYMYFNLLPGRFFFSHLNFRSELGSRMEEARPINDGAYGGSAGDFEELVEHVIDYLGSLFAEGSVAKAEADIEQFCADFLTWSTSGSAPNKGLELMMPDGSRMRTSGGNKSSQLNKMGIQGILECLDVDPSCIGQPTYKFEAGKLRMLLPGPLYHWVVESMALWGGEGHVLRSVDEIALEQSSYVEFIQLTNRLASTGSETARACSDYADYNILHTFERMQKLWLAQADALDARLALPAGMRSSDSDGILDFIRRACRWAAAALNNVQARLDDGEYVKLVRGLWTGWRSTMYINVTFNFAYTTAQRIMFIREYGIDPLSRYNVLGDDMEGDSPSLWTALKFVSLIDPLGLDAQASKQMVSLRRAEFLRLMYRDGKTITGSYCRGITGFTSGDTQTSPRYAGVRSAQNICEGLNRIMRRGGDIEKLERAKNLLIKHWTAVRIGDQVYRPSADVLRSPTWMGGMGICRHDGKDARFVQIVRARVRMPRYSQANSSLSKLMVRKGWSKIQSWEGISMPDHRDVDASVMASILPPKVRQEFARMERQDTVEYYRQKGTKVKKNFIPELYQYFDKVSTHLEDDRQLVPRVAYKPNDWWRGLVRDAMGVLASHPQSERLMGKAGPQKLANVMKNVTSKVDDAKSKLLSLDIETVMGTVTGRLEKPSPLAGLVSPLCRHLIDMCHSGIVSWLCKQSADSSSKWNQCIVNALYTFEIFFIDIQGMLLSKYRV